MSTQQPKYCCLWLFFSLVSSALLAQTNPFNVKGKVTASDGEESLPGVNIIVKGSSAGTVTDIDGRYSINVPDENDTLIFSSIGYTSQEIPINGRAVIDLTLAEDIKSLSEVVVIGYGTQQKMDLTGAVSQIKAEQLENENPNAVQDILRGNVSGLNVGFSANAKGGGSLEVRGKTTLNANSDPLIVLDGVIYYGALSDINPNDIATVDVLKDASSAAVFGAKSANGVILITTKKGSAPKPTITFNSNVGLANMAVNEPVYSPQGYVNWREDVMESINANYQPYQFSDPRMLPSDITLDEWLAYDGSSGDPVTVWLNRLSMEAVEIENYKAGKSVDWYDMVFQNGFRQDHTISLSGKKDELSYYMSLGYTNNEGIVVGDKFSTIRGRLNLEGKVTDFLTVGMNTQFSDRDESQVAADWGQIRRVSPWGSEFDEEGSLRYSPQDDPGGGSRHPFLAMAYTDRLNKHNTLNTTIFGNVTLPLGISYRINFNTNYDWHDFYNHQSAQHPDWANRGGIATRLHSKSLYWQVDNILSWKKTFADVHNVDLTLLANAEKYQSWIDKMENNSFDPSDQLGYHNISAGINPIIGHSDAFDVVNGNGSDSEFIGDQYSTGDALMGRLFYSFDQRYMLTLSVRRDGYSAFGQSNPRATFPSAALGWVLSEENFYNSDWLSYAKLRFSWGVNGNRDIGRYAALSDLNTGKYLLVADDGTVYQVSQLYVNNMSNEALRWEKTTAFNLGFDFSLFDNVLDGTLEAYHMSTTDLLVQRSLPDVLGFDWVWDNLGEVQNRGFELSLQSRIMNRPNFAWNSSLNFSLNRNKIIHLYGDMVDVVDEQGNVIGQEEVDDFENEWFIGHAIDEIWDMREIGVWQTNEAEEANNYGVSPGDFKVKDVNGDLLYTREDKEFLGFENPRFRWTLRNEFNIYKNFNLSFMIYSYWGHMAEYNLAKNRDGFLDRSSSYVLPYWTPENPLNDYARLYSSEGSAVFNVYRKKSFIRLNNVALSYNLPTAFVQKASISNCKVYFNIQNAAVWAPDWTFWDPENSGPTPRYFTLGVNVTL